MKNVEILAGTGIGRACAQLVAAARNSNQTVRCEFNGVEIIADANSIPSNLSAKWSADFERQAEEWRKSPAGLKAARDAENRRDEAQATYDRCMAELSALDFCDDEALLDWMCEIQDAAAHADVQKNSHAILKAFAQHGFTPNMNLGPLCDENNRHSLASYIIGQGLDGVSAVGAPHWFIKHFIQDWKAKFSR